MIDGRLRTCCLPRPRSNASVQLQGMGWAEFELLNKHYLMLRDPPDACSPCRLQRVVRAQRFGYRLRRGCFAELLVRAHPLDRAQRQRHGAAELDATVRWMAVRRRLEGQAQKLAALGHRPRGHVKEVRRPAIDAKRPSLWHHPLATGANEGKVRIQARGRGGREAHLTDPRRRHKVDWRRERGPRTGRQGDRRVGERSDLAIAGGTSVAAQERDHSHDNRHSAVARHNHAMWTGCALTLAFSCGGLSHVTLAMLERQYLTRGAQPNDSSPPTAATRVRRAPTDRKERTASPATHGPPSTPAA